MSTVYAVPLRNVAYRVGALRGKSLAPLETSFATSPLTLAELDGPFPLTALKDAVQQEEEALAREIAEDRENALRAYLRGVTASLANEAALPSVDSLSRQIIGVFGSVYDSSDGTQLTERDLAEVRLLARNANSWRKCPAYHFKLDGGRIYHTRTGAVLECCVYDWATQRTAIDANSNMLLPDVTLPRLVEGAAGRLGMTKKEAA